MPERGRDCGVGSEEEAVRAGVGPFGRVVIDEFGLDFVDAEDDAVPVCIRKLLPEPWAEIESVVQVLRLQEYVGVEDVWHQPPNASERPNS